MLGSTEISGEFLVAIGNLPLGAALSAGTATPDGAWIVGADQFYDLTLTPPSNMSGALTLLVTPITVGADEVAVVGTAVPLVVDVHGVVDAPILSVSTGSSLESAPLSAGTQNADGSSTLSGDQLTSLAPTSAPHSSADSTINIAATAHDNLTGSDATAASTQSGHVIDVVSAPPLSVAIDGVADGAVLSAGTQNADASSTLSGDQLTSLAPTPESDSNVDSTLNIAATAHDNLTNLTGNDATSIATQSGHVIDVVNAPPLSVAIDGVADGAALSAGTQNADGSSTLSGDQLTSLAPTPATDSNVDSTLNISATAHDNLTGNDATSMATQSSHVLDVVNASPLSVAIDGVADGAALSAGTQNADGSSTLSGDQLTSLAPTLASDSSVDSTLNILATAHDNLTGTDATTAASLPVNVIDVLDAPTLVPTADATANMTDAEFLQAIEQLSSPIADTSHGGSVLDPVVSAPTSAPDLSANATPTTWGTTETTVVHDTTVAVEPPPPPPPPDPTTTVSFTSPAHL